MRETARRVLKNQFVKKRLMFIGHADDYEPKAPTHPEYDVWVVHDGDDDRLRSEHVSFLVENVGGSRLEALSPFATSASDRVRARFDSGVCSVFLVVDRETTAPVGFTWWLLPVEDILAFELPIDATTTLAFNAYTHEDHRRNGVFYLYNDVAMDYVFDRGYDRYIGFVNESNDPVLNAYEKGGIFGAHRANNYLLRFLGVDLFSVITTLDDSGIEVVTLVGKKQLR